MESKSDKLTREEVIKANQYVHAAIIDKYDDEPHFRPENLEKVRNMLKTEISNLRSNGFGEINLLDFGCGTGFIISLAKDLVESIKGIDVTQEMLDKVDVSNGNIELTCCMAEETPFTDASFQIATAYSFMDHLLDYRLMIKEAYRVLENEGVFYIDLNPNRYFWGALSTAENENLIDKSKLVSDEIFATVHNDERVSSQFDIDIGELKKAEPMKNDSQGFDPEEVISVAKEIGFRRVEFVFDWYLGQGKVMHRQSFSDAEIIENHLREILPLSKHLFKYIRFLFYK